MLTTTRSFKPQQEEGERLWGGRAANVVALREEVETQLTWETENYLYPRGQEYILGQEQICYSWGKAGLLRRPYPKTQEQNPTLMLIQNREYLPLPG